MVGKNCKGWNHTYTEGSRSEIRVEPAARTGNHTKLASLPKLRSIFTAETHARRLAVSSLKTISRGSSVSSLSHEVVSKSSKNEY